MKIIDEVELYRIFEHLRLRGEMASPRGMQTLELENFQYTTTPDVRYNRYVARGLSMNYIKRELAWYIKADAYDTSIAQYAKAWGPMINRDNRINSCYGEYWFKLPTGVAYVVQELGKDSSSRRAVIPMYGVNAAHHGEGVVDVPCTTSIEFRIRDGKLNSRVVMRSQDAVLGFGNDLPAFWFLQEVVARLLRVELGTQTVSVGSFHVYERHFRMLSGISLATAPIDTTLDEMPRLTEEDAKSIAQCKIPTQSAFSEWLARIPITT